MKYDKKNIIKDTIVILLYVILGVLGVYSGTIFILFPILAIPMTIWIMSNEINLPRDIMVNIIIVCFIYIITGRIEEPLLYLINVMIPSYIMGIMYKKKATVPNILMYTAVGTMGCLFVYVLAMSYRGIDYVGSYMQVLQQYKEIQLNAIESFIQVNTPEGAEQLKLVKSVIEVYIRTLEYVYPAIFMLMGILLTIIQLAVVTMIGKLKKWDMPSLKQLVQFKLSKVALLVLLLAMIISQAGENIGNNGIMLALNVSILFQNLFQLLGIITLIVMIRRSKANSFIKIFSVIISIILFYMMPSFMMLIGCFDCLFNYRKVQITV
ncbi:MAG: DUF2232 domain-containing protein [Cellulosilyticaceae bacterium]